MSRSSVQLVAAIVLAGGQSRRMGQDKAQLQLQDKALLTRTCRTALAVSQRVTVITARPDHQSLLPQGCELLLEADPQGPLRAFAQGLAQLEPLDDGWVLLLACDLPLLTVEDLVGAIAHLPDLPSKVDAYLPPAVAGARPNKVGTNKQIDWEPLCGFYRRGCAVALEVALANGTRSFQRWLRGLEVALLNDWPPEHLLNCNCPEDWVRVRGMVGDSPPIPPPPHSES